jgi:hypothetical protein
MNAGNAMLMQLPTRACMFAILMLVLCMTLGLAEDKQAQTEPRRLTYEQVLARWDRSCAYGDPRTLRQFSADMVNRLKTGDESEDFSEGLRDGPWIRFYARCEQIFSGVTGLVMIGALLAILFAAVFSPRRFWRRLFRPVSAISNEEGRGDHPIPEASRANGDSRLYGVGGWLLLLCILLTIIGPLLAFGQLSEIATTEFQWIWGIALIVFSLITGILLWTKHRIGWQVANIYFWSVSGLAWVGVCLNASSKQISQAIAVSIVSVIWLLYLNKSKRVWNTYRNTSVPRPTQVVAIPSHFPPLSLDAQLRELAKLREDGIITKDEFDHKKKKILDI